MKTTDSIYADMLSTLEQGDRIHTRNAWVRRALALSWTTDTTPLVSLRNTAWRKALREMEWFLSGSSRLEDLHPSVHSWWQPWADEEGTIAFNYSQQFRRFSGRFAMVDQIALLVQGLREHPYSRRNVITTWNTADMSSSLCPITNCHGTVIQCFVTTANEVQMVMYQRSVDAVCGLPHNMIQYWAFLHWLAAQCNRQVGRFCWIGGDVHIYEVHLSLVREMLAVPLESLSPTPTLVYRPTSESFLAEDFHLEGEYLPRVTARAEMIV